MALNGLGLGFVFSAQDMATGVIRKVQSAFVQAHGAMSKEARTFREELKGLGIGLATMGMGAIGIGGAYGLARTAGEFEKRIRAAGAAADASEEQVKQLRDTALSLSFSKFAQDPLTSAQALQTFAQAGFTASQSMKMLQPTLEFATSSFGEISPSKSAGLAAQVLRAFGMQAGDTEMVMNKLARAMNLFSLKANQLPVVMGVASRGAFVFEQKLDDVLIVAGLVKNIIHGPERTGTAVAVLQERLSTQKTRSFLSQQGIDVIDRSTGKLRPLLDILVHIGQVYNSLGTEKRMNFLEEAFQSKSRAGIAGTLQQLFSGIETAAGKFVKGTEAVRYFRLELENSFKGGGHAANYMNTLMGELLKTFEGQRSVLKASVKALGVELGRPFERVFASITAGIVSSIQGVGRAIHSLPDGFADAIARVTLLASGAILTIGALTAGYHLMRIADPIIGKGGLLRSWLSVLRVPFGGAARVAGAAGGVAGSAIGAIGSGMAKLEDAAQAVRSRRQMGNLAAAFGGIGRSIEETLRPPSMAKFDLLSAMIPAKIAAQRGASPLFGLGISTQPGRMLARGLPGAVAGLGAAMSDTIVAPFSLWDRVLMRTRQSMSVLHTGARQSMSVLHTGASIVYGFFKSITGFIFSWKTLLVGGIAGLIAGTAIGWDRVGLGFRGFMTMIKTGGRLSGPLLGELSKVENLGVLHFIDKLFVWYSKVENFFKGVAHGFKTFFAENGWIIDQLKESLSALGGTWARIFGADARTAPSDAASAFNQWGRAGLTTGAVVAGALGELLRLLDKIVWLVDKISASFRVLKGVLAGGAIGTALGPLGTLGGGVLGGIAAHYGMLDFGSKEPRSVPELEKFKSLPSWASSPEGTSARLVKERFARAAAANPGVAATIDSALAGKQPNDMITRSELVSIMRELAVQRLPTEIQAELKLDGQTLGEAFLRIAQENTLRSGGIPAPAF